MNNERQTRVETRGVTDVTGGYGGLRVVTGVELIRNSKIVELCRIPPFYL